MFPVFMRKMCFHIAVAFCCIEYLLFGLDWYLLMPVRWRHVHARPTEEKKNVKTWKTMIVSDPRAPRQQNQQQIVHKTVSIEMSGGDRRKQWIYVYIMILLRTRLKINICMKSFSIPLTRTNAFLLKYGYIFCAGRPPPFAERQKLNSIIANVHTISPRPFPISRFIQVPVASFARLPSGAVLQCFHSFFFFFAASNRNAKVLMKQYLFWRCIPQIHLFKLPFLLFQFCFLFN